MKLACIIATICFLLSHTAHAATVAPVWSNDTSANNIFFNDTFGHSVVIGTYDPATGLWTSTGSAGGFTNLTVSGNATVAGTLGVTGTSTVGNLTSTGTVSGSGFTSLFASPPPIGATAPGSGAFTTLSATGALSGAGFNSLITAPPLGIGSVTPNGGAFTSLSASSTVSGAGFANYLLSPPAIGNTAPNTGKFTMLTATGNSNISGVPFNTAVAAPGSMSPPAEPGILLTGGVSLYVSGAATSAATDVATGVLYVTKNASYTGVPSTTVPTIYAFNNVAAGVQGPQEGVLGYVVNSNTLTSQPTGSSGAIGVQGLGACNVTGCTATWGGVMSGYDTTGQANPTNSFYGLEVDNYAHGTDSNNVRIGIQIVASTPDGLGTLNTVGRGLFFSGNGAAHNGQFGTFISGNGSVAVNAMDFSTATLSGNLLLGPGGAVIDKSANALFNSLGMPINSAVFWGTNTGTNGAQIVQTTGAGGMFFDNRGSGDFIFRVGSGLTEQFRALANGTYKPVALTVSTLPTCNAGSEGSEAFINDANTAPSYNNAIPVGGGANRGHVLCRNSAWVWD